MKIKNIILDLGGVIIDIDYNETIKAFSQIGALQFDEIFSQQKQTGLFDEFETGKMSNAEFRSALKDHLNVSISDEQFDYAWNAMLGKLPEKRIKIIESLKNNYNVFLFSNTNDIHLKKVYKICYRDTGRYDFVGLFEREYFSHIFGMRKPNPEAFLSIIGQNNLNPEETIFVDDSEQHIDGAKCAGLHAIHFKKGMDIEEIEGIILTMT